MRSSPPWYILTSIKYLSIFFSHVEQGPAKAIPIKNYLKKIWWSVSHSSVLVNQTAKRDGQCPTPLSLSISQSDLVVSVSLPSPCQSVKRDGRCPTPLTLSVSQSVLIVSVSLPCPCQPVTQTWWSVSSSLVLVNQSVKLYGQCPTPLSLSISQTWWSVSPILSLTISKSNLVVSVSLPCPW